jgi:hypothetical protein
MAKPQPPVKDSTPAQEPAPQAERELLSVEKRADGWVVMAVRVRGSQVLGEKVLSHPSRQAAIAIEAFKREFAAKVLR